MCSSDLTMDFILASQANSVVRMDRLEENLDRLEEESARQKDFIDGLARVSQDLLKVSANVVERTKRLETRAGSVDEMLKILRELMEANLRSPDNPKQGNS